MIKDNQKAFNQLHIVTDGVFVLLAYFAAYMLRFVWLNMEKAGDYTIESYARFLIVVLPVYLLIYWTSGLYAPKRGRGMQWELWLVLKANIISGAAFIVLLFLFKMDISRTFLAIFYSTNVILESMFRFFLRKFLEHLRRKGKNLKHILIVGYSRAAEAYVDRILANPQWGYFIHGILDDKMAVGTRYKKVSVVGSLSELSVCLKERDYDEIAIALAIEEYEKLEKLVAACEYSGVHTKFIPDYNHIVPTVPYIEDLEGLPVINIRKVPLSNVANRAVKRTIDIVGALFALLLFAIPMLTVAILIKCTSKGPVIFSQVRVGLHNKEFKMYKFRSMVVQEASKEANAWTTKNDTRVTGVGKFIRKTSIDELPQLINVLKGDMSLVGPRPERPKFVEKFKEEIPRYMIKHQVRPGITGWAQVNGYRGDTSIRKRIEHDVHYIENWTLGFDIKILFLTIFKGFINKNAY
ncbi:MAG: undecaprenyl-phosphate glucose phosphotransferase [Lachnospiraceae bacterium]|nr:undecaprenyl-phosphate glucose phosphotransferase [Lachnospiraceae bacterium]MBQ8547059.1 undecaprenyl-phosphate glucose phosphotransferase [Lachnospiraceae bacterium]